MAAGFKKILLEGDAAELSTTDPVAVGTTLGPGAGATASKYDHVHVVGAGAINNANMFATGVIDAAALGSNSVAASEIDETADDIAFNQIILTPRATGGGTTEGTLYYDSDTDHPYIYTGS